MVLDKVVQVSSISKDLQLESAGYYFTGDTSFLPPYVTAKDQVLANVKELRRLTADNASQQHRIDLLERLIHDLITFSDASIQLRNKNAGTAVNFSHNVRSRKIYRDEIKNSIEQIRNEESRLLLLREAANSNSLVTTTRLFYVLIGLIFILLILAFLFILYQFKKQKKAEEELRETGDRFSLLVNNIKDFAIFMIDSRGNIMNCYSGAEYVKGYSNTELIGKPISVFYSEEEIERGEPEYNLKMAAEQGHYETEGWRIRKDGSAFWADVVITAIYDDMGNVQGFTKIARDYTLHKKAEDKVKNALEKEKELSEMKSNFVSMASHEFRTPLSSILSSASLLAQYNAADQQEKRERHIKRIKSSVNDLISILEEFLSLEKIEEGKVKAKAAIFNLKELTGKLCIEMKNVARPGQTITYVHEGEDQVNLDPAFIHHILINLISNAIKYSPENSPIHVLTKVNDTSITLLVKDAGIGIAEQDQKHLFERFFRASGVTNIQGTGLGLHIIKRYVDMMNGTINVKSKPGQGTEFIVEINK